MPETLIGTVPSDWQVTTLGDLCRSGGGEIQTGPFGSQLHAADYVPVGIPSVMPQNIGDNVINEDGIARITPQDANRLARYLLREGDIVYSRRGDVERRAIVRVDQKGWLCGTGCLRVRAGNAVDPFFLSYYLGHQEVRGWIVQHAIGATMPNLNTGILSSLPMVVPPAYVQQSISNILGALDDKIAINKQISGGCAALASATFARDVWDYRNVAPLPAGYSWGCVEDLCERVGNGGTPKRAVSEYWEGGSIPWFKTGELFDAPLGESGERITERGLRESNCSIWPAGTVLVALYASPTVGRLGILSQPATFNQACSALRAKSNVGEFFLFETIKATRYELQQIAVGAAQQNISQSVLRAHKVVIAPPEVRWRYAELARPLYLMRLKAFQEIYQLSELRDSLLPGLMSGAIRVRDAEKAVEEAL